MAEGKEKGFEIVGIEAALPSQPGDDIGYSGISRSDAGWYLSTPGDHDRFLEYLHDLPSAIADYEKQHEWVKHGVMEDYAKWKMENDCDQRPEPLAAFFRISVTKWKFYKQLNDAFIGAMG